MLVILNVCIVAAISSAWMQEVKQHGGFSTTDNYNNIEWLERP